MLSTLSRACPTCAWSDAQKKLACRPDVRKRLIENSAKAAELNRKDPAYVALRKRCEVAKNRCQCPTNAQYANCGGRGIEFRFASAVAMAEWVLATLGPPPSAQYSLDRADNDGHYEPGNLRWADDFVQAGNKRQYRCTATGSAYVRFSSSALTSRTKHSAHG